MSHSISASLTGCPFHIVHLGSPDYWTKEKVEKRELKKSQSALNEKLLSETNIGATICVKNIKNGTLKKFTIVSPSQADPVLGRISYASPVGQALIDAWEGEIVQVQPPKGVVYKVISIEKYKKNERISRQTELSKFRIGTVIVHKKFGKGIVTEIKHGIIKVSFRTKQATLVSAFSLPAALDKGWISILKW